MKINILLPYKEKFDNHKASSVSITVSNNMQFSSYIKDIRVFGQKTEDPLFKENFLGFKNSFLSFRSKNRYLVDKMIMKILNSTDPKQLIEVHNRPYLVNYIKKRINLCPISLFLHNNPKEMRGSKSIEDRVRLLSNCSAIFCVSEFIKNEFIEGLTDNLHKVFVLYNGVERKISKFPNKKKEVLFVGRLVYDKGVDLYVDVISSIASRFLDWKFNLIGSHRLGERENKNSFAYKITKKFEKIGQHAKYYGFKDHNFVEQKMRSSSIIIIPSRWQEPFGLVAAEAMSNGIAIIASKVGGLPEIIKTNGILIDNINFEKLKKNLIDLINDQTKREILQKKAWESFNLTSEISSGKLDNFRDLINQSYFK